MLETSEDLLLGDKLDVALGWQRSGKKTLPIIRDQRLLIGEEPSLHHLNH